MDNNYLLNLLDSIDPTSKVLLLSLWWRRHASIVDIRKELNLNNDFDIIYRIKHVINANSEKLLGYPIVVFKESQIDPYDGKQWFFQWWFVDEMKFIEENSCIDVYFESNKIILMANVKSKPKIQPEMARVIEYKNGLLKVTLDKE